MRAIILLDIQQAEVGRQTAMLTIKPRGKTPHREAVWSLTSYV